MDLCFGIEIRTAMSDEFEGLDATEKAGIGATLNRCRVLAAKIANDLRNKRPEHFVDKLSLADIHTSTPPRDQLVRAPHAPALGSRRSAA